MGFFDKVTKAVGSAVDKTKKEADQFMRIQKIKGEIGDMEKKIAGFNAEIAQARTEAGTKAIEMVRAGSLAAPELQPFGERVACLEQNIEAEQAAIAGKRADIERIKAEDEQPAAAAQPQPAAEPPVPPAPPSGVSVPVPPLTPAEGAPPPVPGTAAEAPVSDTSAPPPLPDDKQQP